MTHIPKKPAGGSLDLEMLCNYHFQYMRKPVMKGQVMPGVSYDLAVDLINRGKAKIAGSQTPSKVNEDGSTGRDPGRPANPVAALNWDQKKKTTAQISKPEIMTRSETKDAGASDLKTK